MAKKKTEKPVVVMPASYEAANGLVQQIGKAQRELVVREERLAGKVAKLTALVHVKITPLQESIATMSAQVQAYCDANRDELLNGDVKHHNMPAGRIGWRCDPPSVEIKKGLKVADVVVSILKLKLRRKFLRLAFSLDKEAMLKDQEKAETIPGIKIKRDVETFYVEPVAGHIADGGK